VIDYLGRVWQLHHFWLALVRSDLRARYRRSMIGMGWSLLHPIAMTIVLCFVFARIFQADVRTYAPFLLAGLITWNFLTSVIGGGCQSLLQGEAYIRQHPAPLAIYPLRTTLAAGIHFGIGMVVVLVLVWGIQGPKNLPALAILPFSALLLLLFGWALAICTGVINVMFQDTQHLVEVALQILFYVTPVLYPSELLQERRLGWALGLNPLAAFLELVRVPILHGQLPPFSAFAIATLTTAIAMGIASLLLWRVERRMIFYL
jgi:ABC-type polysaccharide/polyol phosphate export permease